MGFEHVIPQFALRLHRLKAKQPAGRLRFEFKALATKRRSFCFVDDLVAGVMVMRAKGEHLGIYHIGTMEEVAVADLAERIAWAAGRDIELIPSAAAPGSVPRRCPDISKLGKLGYKPRVSLDEGLKPTLDWYWSHSDLAPKT